MIHGRFVYIVLFILTLHITNASTVGIKPATFDQKHFNLKSFDFRWSCLH